VSGFRICVDRKRPNLNRIVSLQVPVGDVWQEIDAAQEYDLVVPDFLYRGGDGYEIPRRQPASKTGSELKYLVLDAIMSAHARGQKVGAALAPENPRIVVLDDSSAECFE
jgi:2',3'-cyclic-nucleotide 2'-phosphodiesterase (5'-nucleotidase family)